MAQRPYQRISTKIATREDQSDAVQFMVSKEQILDKFKVFSGRTGGIDNWLTPDKTPGEVFGALSEMAARPLTRALFNQLLTLSHEAPMSDAFFRYYWLEAPSHVYDVRKVSGFSEEWLTSVAIGNLQQLYWGLYRFYIDALLFFGNIRTAYQALRDKSKDNLRRFFSANVWSPVELSGRGAPLALSPIGKDNRYLISEMACKSYEASASEPDLRRVLLSAFEEHQGRGGGPVSIGQLVDGDYMSKTFADRRLQFQFSLDDLLEEQVTTGDELIEKFERVATTFKAAREAALKNTANYLSMVGDLDVYVATSMRTRAHFRSMAEFCETVFGDPRLQALHLRYFDPTLSAASNHEDKGLIECLMVKCAKVLVYHAGERESYGKDAEAAMALSLGKPVIFHCDEEERQRFYREVHPLSRLIDFQTGVAVGVMVTDQPEMVSELLHRIFTNDMQYTIEQPRPGYLCLLENLTQCTVRLQTNDELLRETFWNNYGPGR